ncbi:hypothetical protein JRI60_11750 [Archangium violaceum]|uniref:hypothetical protein n=1 Tax=Archangium violaceum TaxID=83451 RepID=UPI0019523B73|nr:hypothetical protein [Archangium violaceum]QRN99647.1 hypothetical protein JRI60_11750 [Archangium violaceum]
MHFVNNYHDGKFYMGIGASDDVVSLIEGNYFSTASYFFPVYQSSTNKVFAPLDFVGDLRDQCVVNRSTSPERRTKMTGLQDTWTPTKSESVHGE